MWHNGVNLSFQSSYLVLLGFSVVSSGNGNTWLTSDTQLDVEMELILGVPLLHCPCNHGDFQDSIVSVKISGKHMNSQWSTKLVQAQARPNPAGEGNWAHSPTPNCGMICDC